MSEHKPAPRRQSSGQGLRIGAVSYLNSKPLIAGLTELLPEAQLILDLPSRLAEGLARGDFDVALIPSIEACADHEYGIISDACVATRGPVLSVKFYGRVPPGEIRTLALDEGSRTSAALVRILLYERFGVAPEVFSLPIGRGVEDTPADGILLIGDRAMQPPVEAFHTTWDLGEEWLRWTGLPFVFAMWVGRAGTGADGLARALECARDRGVQDIPRIAAHEAGRLGISCSVATQYLSRNLHFRLGSAERQGLALYYRLAARLGLAPQNDSFPLFAIPSYSIAVI